jgi:hypothetical protein
MVKQMFKFVYLILVYVDRDNTVNSRGNKMEEVAGIRRRLHNEELHKFTLEILLGWSSQEG